MVRREAGSQADITVAEAETFIYASRADGPAAARIFRIKEAVPLAALPASRTKLVLDQVRHVYPQFIDGINVLNTSLNNMGAIFHPPDYPQRWLIETTLLISTYVDGVLPRPRACWRYWIASG